MRGWRKRMRICRKGCYSRNYTHDCPFSVALNALPGLSKATASEISKLPLSSPVVLQICDFTLNGMVSLLGYSDAAWRVRGSCCWATFPTSLHLVEVECSRAISHSDPDNLQCVPDSINQLHSYSSIFLSRHIFVHTNSLSVGSSQSHGGNLWRH